MRRRAVAAVLGSVLCLWAAPGRAQSLTSAGGFLFDVDPSTGSLVNGSIDAYDMCYFLEVDGTRFQAVGAPEVDGRLVVLRGDESAELRVVRSVFVPDEPGRDYARYADVIENRSASPRTVTVRYTGNLGSDSWTHVISTASGDGGVDRSDEWFVTDDEDGSGDPSLGHVFFGPGARVLPSLQRLTGDDLEVRFELDLAPRQRAVLLVFAVQAPSRAEARAQAEGIVRDASAAASELYSRDAAEVVSFRIYGRGSVPLGRGRIAVPAPTAREPDALDVGPAAAGTAPELAPPALVPREQRVPNGALRLAVRDPEARAEEAIALAESLGGGLVSREDLSLVVRVPSGRFREALAGLEGLGDLLERQVLVEELSEQVRDLRVRLQSAREVRERLLALQRQRSTTVEEALAIERELEELNREIAELEAALASLEDEVRWSSIALVFEPVGLEPEPPIRRFELPIDWLDRLGLDRLLRT